MATFHTSLFIPRAPADVFSFVSDFRHAPKWDPRTYSAVMVTDEPVRLGSRFELQGGLLTKNVHADLPAVPVELQQRDHRPAIIDLRGKAVRERVDASGDFVSA